MKKYSKIIVLVLSIAIIACLALGISAMAEEGGDADAKLTVLSQNVSYSEKMYLYYAVYPENVDTEGLVLNVYSSDPEKDSEAVLLAAVTESSEVTITDNDISYVCRAFVTPGVALKNLATKFYVQAVATDGTKSAVKRYSVVEYLNEMMLTSDSTDKAAAYGKMLAAGDAAQLLLNYYPGGNTDIPTNYKYVKVSDGALSDGYSRGVYLAGSNLTLTYTGEDTSVVGWTVENLDDGTLEFVAKDSATLTIDANLSITPNTAGYVFAMGSGVYYNDATATNAVRFDFTSKKFSQSGQVTTSLADGVMKIEKNVDSSTGVGYASEGTAYAADGAVADSVYTSMTNPALVFESDVKFEGFDNEAISNIMVRFQGLGVQNRFYMATDGEKVTLSGTNLSLDIGTWYNLRFEVYKTSDSGTYGTYSVKIYVNNEYIGTKTATTEAASTPTFRVRWYLTKDATAPISNIYMDNAFYGYVDKAYVANQ